MLKQRGESRRRFCLRFRIASLQWRSAAFQVSCLGPCAHQLLLCTPTNESRDAFTTLRSIFVSGEPFWPARDARRPVASFLSSSRRWAPMAHRPPQHCCLRGIASMSSSQPATSDPRGRYFFPSAIEPQLASLPIVAPCRNRRRRRHHRIDHLCGEPASLAR